MKQKTVSGVLLTLLLIGILTFVFDIQPVKADWTWTETIYIRIDGSVDPDTAPISTANNITYTLTDNIVGDVPWDSSVIVVQRNNIVVDGAGYTLQGTQVAHSRGIDLSGRSNVTIKNLKATNLARGIYLSYSRNNTLSGNTVVNNRYGIRLDHSNNNKLTNNNASNNDHGITLEYSGNNKLTNNTASNNGEGIYLYKTSNNMLTGNTASSNNYYGIRLDYSNDTMLTGNTASNNRWDGIRLGSSSNNTVTGNTASSNNDYGISLSDSHNNTVTGNTASSNNWCGISLWWSSENVFSHNSIIGNNASNNTSGIEIWWSSENVLFHNSIIGNAQQVSPLESSNNDWDDGYPSGGNYWSDYTGEDQDGDGIGDTPYGIDADNKDNYPLMGPFSFFNAGTWGEATYHVDTVSNSTVSDFQFSESEKLISFNVTGPDGTVGFCRATIPNALLGGPYVVQANDSPPITISEWTNGTHTFIYFTYVHSTKTVEITGTIVVPEFPTWASMLLILIVLTVAIATYKRRLLKTPIH